MIEPDGPRHPLHGVATALAASAALGHRNALVCPCDLADLTVLQVATLLARGGPAVAIGQPLLAVFPVTWASTAARLARAGAPVRSFVAELPTVDLGPIRNLNEPPGPPASG